MLIDTHCHLDFPQFDGWRETELKAAHTAGVRAIVIPGVMAQHWSRLLTLTEQPVHAGIRLYPALGLHPCFMEAHRPEQLIELEALIQQRQDVVALGEIGLDFQIDADRKAQLELFVAQLEIARRLALPVLMHVRKAHDEVLKQLRRLRLPRAGIVHAFSGSEQQAREYAKLGFRLGFGGAISYSRASKLRRLAAELPLEWLVLETDAPDMPLADWRDEPNRPQRVADVAGVIAGLRDIDVSVVAQVTSATARELLALAD